MLKKLLIILGAVLTVVILCYAGVSYYISYQASKYDAAVVPLLQQVIPEISTWQEDAIRRNMSEDALQRIPPQVFSATVEKFSRLGALKSFETPVFKEVSEYRSPNVLPGSGPATTTVSYTSEALYENGEATISLILAEQDGEFQVQYFTIQSLRLAE